MPVFEAKGKLKDGTVQIFTIEAEDRDDAKMMFSHSLPFLDGQVVAGCSIDYRTIKLSAESVDQHRGRLAPHKTIVPPPAPLGEEKRIK